MQHDSSPAGPETTNDEPLTERNQPTKTPAPDEQESGAGYGNNAGPQGEEPQP